MANRPKRSGLRLLAGFTLAILLGCEIQPASANETDTGAVSERFVSLIRQFQQRVVDANALVSSVAPAEAKPAPQATWKPGSARGPYYVDFRARTAASWGHAFVWYGKTSERQVEVAGLTPAGDTLTYVVGHLTFVPSETGASYGDLDPEYLTAHYRVYLNEPDAKRVFAYIKNLQASTPLWNAETFNCNSFVGNIADFMGLKVPHRWQRPEEYVNNLKAMNDGRQIVHLSSVQQRGSPLKDEAIGGLAPLRPALRADPGRVAHGSSILSEVDETSISGPALKSASAVLSATASGLSALAPAQRAAALRLGALAHRDKSTKSR